MPTTPSNSWHWNAARGQAGEKPVTIRMGEIPIIVSPYATLPETVTIRRAWRARLFTWPWRPWVTTATTTKQVPAVFHLPGQNQIVAHPAIVGELQRILRKESAI